MRSSWVLPPSLRLREGLAEALFDGAVLALHGAADAAKFGGGVVVERAVGFDLAAQHTEERCEVVVEQRCGERGDCRASRSACCREAGSGVDEVAPCGDALDYGEEVADLRGFESGAVDAGFVEQRRGVEEAVELEAAAAREHGAHLGGALLLLVDPRLIRAGFERKDPGAAQRR